jgi:hypothetical protein
MMFPTKSLIRFAISCSIIINNSSTSHYTEPSTRPFYKLFNNFNMSHTANPDSFDNGKNVDFIKPKVQRSKPMRDDGVSVPCLDSTSKRAMLTHEQHQLGAKVSPADWKPQFSAETYPPGTAPASNSYTPNPISETGSQANNDLVERSHGKEAVMTTAESTLRGATSKDVHKGLGKPGSGQTKNEIKHEGQHHRKHEGAGLEGVGSYRQDKFERTQADQRALDREGVRGGEHGDKGVSAAEDIPPQSAETVANEWHYEPGTKRDTKRG